VRSVEELVRVVPPIPTIRGLGVMDMGVGTGG
jgi:hypothetical protein